MSVFNIGGDSEKMRNDIHGKWLGKIGEAVRNQDMELAQQMSQITDQVVPFVLNCRNLLNEQGPSNSNTPPSNGPNYSPTSYSNMSKGENVGKAPSSTNQGESLQGQLKQSFGFAHIIPGNDNNVNQDKLFIIFGRCWKEDFELNVTRAVITTNSKIARKAVRNAKVPQLKAICILPNPDWISGENAFDVLDDYISIVGHIRSALPNTKILLPTMPIESGTDCDSAFSKFNSKLVNIFTDNLCTVIKTSELLRFNGERCEERPHILSPELSMAVICELAGKLASV